MERSFFFFFERVVDLVEIRSFESACWKFFSVGDFLFERILISAYWNIETVNIDRKY